MTEDKGMTKIALLTNIIKPMIPSITKEDMELLKNAKYEETQMLMFVIDQVYNAKDIPREVKSMVIPTLNIVAVRSEKDEEMRTTIQNAIVGIGKYIEAYKLRKGIGK